MNYLNEQGLNTYDTLIKSYIRGVMSERSEIPSSLMAVINDIDDNVEAIKNILEATHGNNALSIYTVSIDSDLVDKTAIANAKVTYNGGLYADGDTITVVNGTVFIPKTNILTTRIQDYDSNITINDVECTITVMYIYAEEWVDLGLPSGNLWAKGNLEKGVDGNYFIGDRSDYGAYFVNGTLSGQQFEFLNENCDFHFTPSRFTGDWSASQEKDSITHYISLECRTPNPLDVLELLDNTNLYLVEVNGKLGIKFCQKINENKYIFIPYSGYFNSSTSYDLILNLNSKAYLHTSIERDYYTPISYDYTYLFNIPGVSPSSGFPFISFTPLPIYNGLPVRGIKSKHCSITITLNSTDESSVEGIKIYIEDSEHNKQNAYTNSNGIVTFTNVCTGKVIIDSIEKTLEVYEIDVLYNNLNEYIIDVLDNATGVYALDDNLNLVPYCAANTSCVGFVVITSEHTIAAHKDTVVLDFGTYGTDLSSDAINGSGYTGYQTTSKLIEKHAGDVPLAEYCRSLYNGRGYLGTNAEYLFLFLYWEKIQKLLYRIRANWDINITASSNSYSLTFITSTLPNNNRANYCCVALVRYYYLSSTVLSVTINTNMPTASKVNSGYKSLPLIYLGELK